MLTFTAAQCGPAFATCTTWIKTDAAVRYWLDPLALWKINLISVRQVVTYISWLELFLIYQSNKLRIIIRMKQMDRIRIFLNFMEVRKFLTMLL
jgi:hypothetical protein